MVIEDRKSVVGWYVEPNSEKTVFFYGRRCGRIIKREAIINGLYAAIIKPPSTKAEKNQARLKQLRGRAGRWA